MNKFDGIQSMLGLTDKGEVADTIHQPRQPSRTKYKGGVDRSERCAVGGVCTEVSAAEYLTYTTGGEKTEVFALAEELGGDLDLPSSGWRGTKYK